MRHAVMCLVVLCALVGGAEAKKLPPRGDLKGLENELVRMHGEAQRPRIQRGLAQVGSLWRGEDGDLVGFAREHFVADAGKLDETFARLERIFEALDGHFYEITRELRRAVDLDLGPLLPVDPLLGAFDAGAHLVEDLFSQKIAFVVLLNFPSTTLAERLSDGKRWSRRQWAEARLTRRFSQRIPARVVQAIAAAESASELYIAEYNLWMHHVLGEDGKRLWPSGLRLISHWNLRDELKAAYADKNVARQRTIVKLMERIVSQTIPAQVIDDPRVDWNPFTNAVSLSPAGEIEAEASKQGPLVASNAREPDTRYGYLSRLYQAERQADPFTPLAPTAIARGIDEAGEIPEARVVQLLTSLLDSPLTPRVAAEIEKRLGRKLEAQDLWFNGFETSMSQASLDARLQKKYPTAAAFEKDIPNILVKLGFSRAQARFVASHVVVDASRGAGHAMEAKRRGDSAHLRTRVGKNGMDYKGYNIAVHELGHSVEQVYSLYGVDHTLLMGVPITAITEALAFVFQHRDLELLGLARPSPEATRMHALSAFWDAREIAGVALVDLRVWHWMYANPQHTPAQLREATMGIAREVWNKWYAPYLGHKDSVLLGIYSHMLSSPLYLYNYPLGHLIAFQLEEYLGKKGKARLGAEFERMCRFGSVVPDLWMEHATGAPIGSQALLRATEAALR